MPRSKYATPKQEYIQSPISISIQRLAIKWKTGYRALGKRCNRGKWVEKRQDFQAKMSAKVEERAIEKGGEVQAEEIRRELADLKAVRKHILSRLVPNDVSIAGQAVLVSKPTDYAALANAFIAVDKQICLRRGVSGGAEALGSLLVRITPLDANKPEGEER